MKIWKLRGKYLSNEKTPKISTETIVDNSIIYSINVLAIIKLLEIL